MPQGCRFDRRLPQARFARACRHALASLHRCGFPFTRATGRWTRALMILAAPRA